MAAVALQAAPEAAEAATPPLAAGAAEASPPPVLFLYSHLHNAIRGELDALSSAVLSLDSNGGDAEGEAALLRLKERYRFLEQVYKYHSAVEDEVRCGGQHPR